MEVTSVLQRSPNGARSSQWCHELAIGSQSYLGTYCPLEIKVDIKLAY